MTKVSHTSIYVNSQKNVGYYKILNKLSKQNTWIIYITYYNYKSSVWYSSVIVFTISTLVTISIMTEMEQAINGTNNWKATWIDQVPIHFFKTLQEKDVEEIIKRFVVR